MKFFNGVVIKQMKLPILAFYNISSTFVSSDGTENICKLFFEKKQNPSKFIAFNQFATGGKYFLKKNLPNNWEIIEK